MIRKVSIIEEDEYSSGYNTLGQIVVDDQAPLLGAVVEIKATMVVSDVDVHLSHSGNATKSVRYTVKLVGTGPIEITGLSPIKAAPKPVSVSGFPPIDPIEPVEISESIKWALKEQEIFNKQMYSLPLSFGSVTIEAKKNGDLVSKINVAKAKLLEAKETRERQENLHRFTGFANDWLDDIA